MIIDQSLSEIVDVLGRGEQLNAIKNLHSFGSGRRVTVAALGRNHRRRKQTVLAGRSFPPLACNVLAGRYARVRVNATGDLADNCRLDVNSVHSGSLANLTRQSIEKGFQSGNGRVDRGRAEKQPLPKPVVESSASNPWFVDP